MAVEERIPQDVRDALIKRGHKLTVSGPWVMGSNGAIMVDSKNGAAGRRRRSSRGCLRPGVVSGKVTRAGGRPGTRGR